jgi:hypothetical protein
MANESVLDKYKFTEEEYRDVSLLVDYSIATDYKSVVEIEVLDKNYKVLEIYCKNPECTCSLIEILLVRLENGDIIERYNMSYDYNKRKILESNNSLPQEISEAIINDDELNELFKNRNESMRLVFEAHLLKRALVTNVQKLASVQKIARNDKCPCGSGSKYKNCCGK